MKIDGLLGFEAAADVFFAPGNAGQSGVEFDKFPYHQTMRTTPPASTSSCRGTEDLTNDRAG